MNKGVRTVSPDEAVTLDFIEPVHSANPSASFQKDNCILGIQACYGMEVRQSAVTRWLAQETTVVLLRPSLPERLILPPAGVVALEQSDITYPHYDADSLEFLVANSGVAGSLCRAGMATCRTKRLGPVPDNHAKSLIFSIASALSTTADETAEASGAEGRKGDQASM